MGSAFFKIIGYRSEKHIAIRHQRIIRWKRVNARGQSIASFFHTTEWQKSDFPLAGTCFREIIRKKIGELSHMPKLRLNEAKALH